MNWRDVSHPKSGGAEHVTMEHAKAWVKAGSSVTWLTSHYDRAKVVSIVDGVNFVRRAGSLTIYLYAPFYLLANARSFDVIVDEAHGFPFFAPLFTNKPVVMFIHEIAGEIWDFMFRFPKNVIGKLLEKLYFVVYRNSIFWTDAPSTVEELVERGIPRKQCVAIPCPIIQKHDTKIKNWEKQKHPTFLFVSRVVRMKGVEEVIKAFSFVQRELKDAALWIVGSGETDYIAELQEMVKEYGTSGSVTFFGEVSENKKYELMARAHILLHASVKEGWGLVVLESASVGTPAVVYNVPGLRDVVQHNKTGFVVESSSPVEMARAALKLLSDRKRYSTYQQNGREWASGFKWKDVTQTSLSVLKRTIGKSL